MIYIFELQQYLKQIYSTKEFEILFNIINDKQEISDRSLYKGFNELITGIFELRSKYNDLFSGGILFN